MFSPSQTLVQLAPGSVAKIASLNLPEEARDRVMELGLVPGTPVELVRFAPLGDPVEIRFRGSCLTLQRHEAELIMVNLEG